VVCVYKETRRSWIHRSVGASSTAVGWKRTRWYLLEAAAFTLAASAIITAPVALGKQERALMKTNDWQKEGREGVHSVRSYGNH